MSKEKIESLREIEAECKRFMNRLNAAIERIKTLDYDFQANKESGALKRAALDLKNELTRITQNTL